MAMLLRLLRLFALAWWFAFIAVITLPFQFPVSWKNIRIMSRITRLWGRGIARIVNLRVKIIGPVPDSLNGLIVSNHMGYLDIITHLVAFPLRFTPKSDIRDWFFLGWYVGLNHPIWIDRRSRQKSKEVMTTFHETMDRAIPLIVYPEGTSTSGKEGILPFKSTPFQAVLTGDHAILPIITRYVEPPDRPTVCWYGDMTMLPHVWNLLGLPSIEAEIHILPKFVSKSKDRKEIAAELHQLMSEAYQQIMANATAETVE